MRSLFVVTLVGIAVLATSCQHFQKPGAQRYSQNTQAYDQPIPRVKTINVLPTGDFEVSTGPVDQVLRLNRIGQSVSFYVGDVVRLEIDTYVPGEYLDLRSEFDMQTGRVELTLVDKRDDVDPIEITAKCQVFQVGLTLPEIAVDPSLALSDRPEQIVVTPRMDANCNVVGYEVRYGSTSHGCASGIDNLRQYSDCYNRTNRQVRKRREPAQSEEEFMDNFFNTWK